MSTVKKLITAFLVCALAVVLVVPAYAASASRIGSTSYYYTSLSGFGGGDRSDGKIYCSYAVLEDMYNDSLTAFNGTPYVLSYDAHFGDLCLGVYTSSGGRVGFLSTSDGLVYAVRDYAGISSGGTVSSVDYSSILSSILSAVNAVADNVSSVYGALTYSAGQRVYTVANLLYSSQLNLSHIEEKLTVTNGYIDELESKIDTTNGYVDGVESKLDITNARLSTANSYLSEILTIDSSLQGISGLLDISNTRLNTLNTTTSNGFSDVSSKLTDIENALSNIDVAPYDDSNVLDKIDILTDEVYRGNSNLNTIDSHVDGLESSIVVTNNRISTVDTDLNNIYASTSAGFTDVLNNFSRVSGQLVDIQNLLSGLNNSPVVSTTNSPYVRKIYNVLYDGVDGTGTDMVDIATSQMGISEGRPYYTWYGFNSHVEWCAVFVSWCADQCGYLDDTIPKFAVVDDGADWFKVRSLWLDGGGTPSPGDIIFFDWDVDHDPDHVGIVADCVDGIVTTVEGNTGDSPGVVSSRSIAVDSPLIYGYGTPDYPAGGSSIYSVLVGISNKIGKSPVADVSSYDDTVLIAKLTDIENALSKLGGDVVVSIDQVTNVDIPLDNDAHDVFYVTDDDGDKSIVDLSGNSVKIVGKLMNFLYQAMFKDALNDSESGIQGLYDFYLDDSEGVDVWAS